MSQQYEITLKAKDGTVLEDRVVFGKQNQTLAVDHLKDFTTGDCIRVRTVSTGTEKYIGRNERGAWKPLKV